MFDTEKPSGNIRVPDHELFTSYLQTTYLLKSFRSDLGFPRHSPSSCPTHLVSRRPDVWCNSGLVTPRPQVASLR